MDMVVAALDAVARELMLFAAVGFVVGGIDDLLVDLVWIVARVRARFAPDPLLADLPRPPAPLRFAVFVAAWREERVIGDMLREALRAIEHPQYRVYVGTYPNDPATIAAVRGVTAIDRRVRLVVGPRAGPTTKADNLNSLWRALIQDESAGEFHADAVVIHDAEDLIHPDELRVHEAMLADADLVQVPVVPLIHGDGRLVSGTYADEFAEGHRKSLPVRATLAAALPLAGVGCAVRIDALRRLAGMDDRPFDPASMVEDYELGLRLAEAGCRARFVRMKGRDGTLVATRAYFPHRLDASVRQRARWMAGIALAGWDRTGWAGPLAWSDHWMRMRDRRAPLALLVLAAAYLALAAWGTSWAVHAITGSAAPASGPVLQWLLRVTAGLMIWRMAMRVLHTGAIYGWAEGLRSIPRVPVVNYIALLAVRRALWRYGTQRRGGVHAWDKTDHIFPDLSVDRRGR